MGDMEEHSNNYSLKQFTHIACMDSSLGQQILNLIEEV
jgi:hypothetical protein